MARLSELMRSERAVTIDIHGDSLTIVYNPGKITANWQTKVRTAYDRKEYAGVAVASALVDVLVKWDLLEDDDSVVAITTKRLRSLPMEILGMVMGAVMVDLRGGSSGATEEAEKK